MSANATFDINSHVDLFGGEIKRGRFQNFADFPNATGVLPGWTIYHTVHYKVYTWTGKVWLDLSQIYTHPTYTLTENNFATAQTAGLQILAELLTNSTGHVIKIGTRTLTNADIVSIFLNDAIQSGTFTWSSNKIKDFVENTIGQSVTGALVYQPFSYVPATVQGNIVPPVPVTATTIKQGMVWVVNAAGWFGSQKVDPGDMIIAKADNAASVEANYQIVNKNIEEIVQATEAIKGIVALATAAEGIAGTNTEKAITPAVLKAVLDEKIGGYVANFGDGSSTTFTFNHPLNTQNLITQIYRNADNKKIHCSTVPATNSTVVVDVLQAPNAAEYRIVIVARK